MRMSKSAVLCYRQCPYRFYLEYIKKVPRKVIPKALKKGSEVHDLMDKFYDTKSTTITEAVKEIKQNPLMTEHKEVMNNFIKFNHEVISEGEDKLIKPLFKEIKMYDHETNISGRVDAIQADGNKLILIDYKTGKEHSLKKFRFELALYTYLFEKQYNQKITHWGIYFVDTDKFKVEPKDTQEMVNALKEVADVRILVNAEKFDKKPSWLCKWCSSFQSGYCSGKRN